MYYLFYLISILYTAFCVYFFVYKKLKEPNNKRMKIKAITLSSILIICSIYLPVFMILVNSYIYRVSIIYLWITIVVILLRIPDSMIVDDNKVIKVSKLLLIIRVFYILFYLPILVLYVYRFSSTDIILEKTVEYTFLFLGIFLLFRLLHKIKYRKIASYVQQFFGTFLLLLYVIIIREDVLKLSNVFDDTNSDNIYIQIVELELDYHSINHYVVDDDIIDGSLIDFYFDDEYLYYVVASDTEAYLRIYNIDSDEIVYSRKLEIPSVVTKYFYSSTLARDKNIISVINDTIYLFSTDGIYIIDGLIETKIADYSALDAIHFNMNDDTVDFVYSPSDDIYQIFSINEEGLVLIEELDYSEEPNRYFLSRRTDKLVINDKELETYQIYDGTLFAPSINENEWMSIDLINEYHMIYSKYVSSNIYGNDRKYYILYSNGTTEILENLDGYYFSISEYNNLYYKTDYYNSSYDKVNYFYDEFLDEVHSFYPVILNSSIFGKHPNPNSVIHVYDDHLYYGAYISNDNSLSFEINEYVIMEPNVDLKYFDFVNLGSGALVLFTFIIPTSIVVKKKKTEKINDK